MGKDNQPRARQAAQLARKAQAKQRTGTDRVLIVCEGSKTEPRYFDEIRRSHRLPSANLQVLHSDAGTDPLTVVNYAEKLLVDGSRSKQIAPKNFEHVFAVFDRDEHRTYTEALQRAQTLDGKHRNDLKQPVRFRAIASVPCFELWLLLHFQDQQAAIHRDAVCAALREHMPHYQKGQGGHYKATMQHLALARQRAAALAQQFNPFNGHDPYTNIHDLVELLTQLRQPR